MCHDVCMSRLLHHDLSGAVIGGFYNSYDEIGPGFSESVCQNALAVELQHLGIPYAREVRYPVLYRGVEVGLYRADFIVADSIIVEIKCADSIGKEHIRQVLYYLKASNLSLGLILNFGPRASIKRVIR